MGFFDNIWLCKADKFSKSVFKLLLIATINILSW